MNIVYFPGRAPSPSSKRLPCGVPGGVRREQGAAGNASYPRRGNEPHTGVYALGACGRQIDPGGGDPPPGMPAYAVVPDRLSGEPTPPDEFMLLSALPRGVYAFP